VGIGRGPSLGDRPAEKSGRFGILSEPAMRCGVLGSRLVEDKIVTEDDVC
jgi:hypothetical protein